ncbi:nucleotidyltransferase family protein [Winogradskyella sp. A2]|uniref:nucleotidyltransferase family protein n=1 Tax=Winogradskyella sp. A2 TaxID=3366944 RepID=UPI00398C5A3E
MRNLAKTYQAIADILSFNSSNSKLEQTLLHPTFNWDTIVTEGSRHLVLPTIYCRLKAKELLHILPRELESYLENLTAINRNRNSAIIKQVQALSQLLNEHNINHVFLKGAALLASGYYQDNAERMVGDIDVLIQKNRLQDAFRLLQNSGYTAREETFGNIFFEHKHLPRLTNSNHLCAVELHRKLFMTYKLSALDTKPILNKKDTKNNILIPCKRHLLLHAILNYQINDHGMQYKHVAFRPAFDTLVLLKDKHMDYSDDLFQIKPIKNYFKYLAIFFYEFHDIKPALGTYAKKFYSFRLRNLKFDAFRIKLLRRYNFVRVLFHRLHMFLMNSEYRKALRADRKRVIKKLKSGLFLKS